MTKNNLLPMNLMNGKENKLQCLSRREQEKIRKGKATAEELECGDLEMIDRICVKEGEVTISDKDLLTIEEHILSMLRGGARIPVCIDWIITNYHFISKDRAKQIINRIRLILRQEYDNYVQNVAQENINTLIQIRNDALAAGHKTVAIQAIDTLNKMTGQYVHKEEVKVTKEEPVVIKFN